MALRLASRRAAANLSGYARIARSEPPIRNASAMAVPTSTLSDEIRADVLVSSSCQSPILSLYKIIHHSVESCLASHS